MIAGARFIALAAVIRTLPRSWKRLLGSPSHTWLGTVETDLGQLNIGLASACRKADIREGKFVAAHWGHIVTPAECAKKEEKDTLPAGLADLNRGDLNH